MRYHPTRPAALATIRECYKTIGAGNPTAIDGRAAMRALRFAQNVLNRLDQHDPDAPWPHADIPSLLNAAEGEEEQARFVADADRAALCAATGEKLRGLVLMFATDVQRN